MKQLPIIVLSTALLIAALAYRAEVNTQAIRAQTSYLRARSEARTETLSALFPYAVLGTTVLASISLTAFGAAIYLKSTDRERPRLQQPPVNILVITPPQGATRKEVYELAETAYAEKGIR